MSRNCLSKKVLSWIVTCLLHPIATIGLWLARLRVIFVPACTAGAVVLVASMGLPCGALALEADATVDPGLVAVTWQHSTTTIAEDCGDCTKNDEDLNLDFELTPSPIGRAPTCTLSCGAATEIVNVININDCIGSLVESCPAIDAGFDAMPAQSVLFVHTLTRNRDHFAIKV